MTRQMNICLKISLAMFVIAISMPVTGQESKHDRFIQVARVASSDKTSGFVSDIKPEYEKLAMGKFLIASERIKDPRFSRSVILIIAHNQSGTLGLIINRQTDARIAELLPDIKGFAGSPDLIYVGGPVQIEEAFLLFRTDSKPDDAKNVFDNIHISQSLVLLKRLADEKKPEEKFRLYVGYAGWAAGQLEAEVIRGDWVVRPADPEILFDKDPAGVWDRLMPRKIEI
jgi:putative transcriptional regulator